MFQRLPSYFGINDKVLSWIYLHERKQKVKLNNFYSDDLDLLSGVPQGSVLGPMYVFPIKDVIYKDIFTYHLYADDTQLYSKFHPSDIDNVISSISKCKVQWMSTNG